MFEYYIFWDGYKSSQIETDDADELISNLRFISKVHSDVDLSVSIKMNSVPYYVGSLNKIVIDGLYVNLVDNLVDDEDE